MRNTILKAVAVVLCLVTVFACTKEAGFVNQTAPLVKGSVWANLVAKLGAQTQSFNIDAAKGGDILTENNIHFTVPADALVFQDNTPVEGNVSFTIQEFNQVSKLMLNDMPTMTTDGRALDSWGTFYIAAHQDGKSLKLRDNMAIKASKKFVNNANIAKNKVQNWIAESQNGSFAWRLLDDSRRNDITARTSDELLEMYISLLDARYNWDFQMEEGNKKASVYFQNGYENVSAFFVPEHNIGALKFSVARGNEISTPERLIPEGLNGTLMIFGVKDGELYLDQQKVTDETYHDNPDLKFEARFERIDEGQLTEALNRLDRRRGRRD